MSTIKKDTPKPTTTRNANRPAPQSQISRNSSQTGQNRSAQRTERSERTSRSERFDESSETREARENRRNRRGERTREGNESDDKKALEDKVRDLEKQLGDLRNQPQQQAQQPSGGCCGSSGNKGGDEAKAANSAQGTNNNQQNQGPDNELQQLAAAALQQAGNQGGLNSPFQAGPNPGGGIQGRPNPAGQARPAGFNPRMGAPGQAGGSQAKQALAQRASQLAQQGFQPQLTTRILVQSALGYDAFQNQGQTVGFPQMGGAPQFGANNLGGQSFNFGAPAGVRAF